MYNFSNFTCEPYCYLDGIEQTDPIIHEWKGSSITDRVNLIFLQVQHSLRPEIAFMAEQMLEEGNVRLNDTKKAAEAVFWGFKNRYRYTHDPWEIDFFTNLYRAWLIGGGSPDCDLSKGGIVFEDCDGAATALIALLFLSKPYTGVGRVGAKIIGPVREYTHIYGVAEVDGKLFYLDPTVSSFGPNQEAPKSYRGVERVLWFDPSKQYGRLQHRTPVLAEVQESPLDYERTTPKSRVKALARRIYRSVRDPAARVTAVRILREAECPARQDLLEANAILDGVKSRFRFDEPNGGTLRTMGRIVDDVAYNLRGDYDDAAMAICSIAMSIGFRSGLRTLPNGAINAVVQMPKSLKGDHKPLDLSLDAERPFYGSGGIVSWYQDKR